MVTQTPVTQTLVIPTLVTHTPADLTDGEIKPTETVKRKRGEGRRLTDAERYEIIKIIEEPGRPSLRQIARDFEIGEKTIRNIRNQKDIIKARIADTTEAEQLKTKRVRKKKDGTGHGPVRPRAPRKVEPKAAAPLLQELQFESRPVEASFVNVVTATLHGLAETLEQNPTLTLSEDVRADFVVAVQRALDATSSCH